MQKRKKNPILIAVQRNFPSSVLNVPKKYIIWIDDDYDDDVDEVAIYK